LQIIILATGELIRTTTRWGSNILIVVIGFSGFWGFLIDLCRPEWWSLDTAAAGDSFWFRCSCGVSVSFLIFFLSPNWPRIYSILANLQNSSAGQFNW